MSGGVDSSVAAYLLKQQGYEVIGAHMRLWFREEDEALYEQNSQGCCSLAAASDAEKVAYRIGIPFYVLNFKQKFHQRIVKSFISEYLKGRTPNPCIDCNRFIKWEEFLKRAQELGCEYISTGHYARIKFDASSNRYLLYKGLDKTKDQTYMLSHLNQTQLARTLFPLGIYKKDQVREMAEKIGLNVANKPESQEICFIPNNDYGEFLNSQAPEKIQPGPIYDMEGNFIANHKGICFYTIGQRKGLGIALGKPVYVIDIDYANNALIIGEKKHLYFEGLLAEDLNFIPFRYPNQELEVETKIRYNSPAVASILIPLAEQNTAKVKFFERMPAVTPGQGVTFYRGDLVIGGGIIKDKLKSSDRG